MDSVSESKKQFKANEDSENARKIQKDDIQISKSIDYFQSECKKKEIDKNMLDDVSNIVNNIIASVNSGSDGEEETYEIPTFDFKNVDKVSIKSEIKASIIDDDILPESFSQIISQIQIDIENNDKDHANLDKPAAKTSTFEMTEVANSKTISINSSDQMEINNTNAKANKFEDTVATMFTSLSNCQSIINDNDFNDIQFTDEQLDQAYNEFKTNNILPPYLMRDPLLGYARLISLQYIVNEDYDKAMENDKHVNNLIASYKNSELHPLIFNWSNLKNNLESRLEMSKRQQTENRKRFNERIQELKKDQEKKLFELDNYHDEERKKFIEFCSTPSFLHRFTKPSSNLLQMRHLQKNLAIQHYFNEAKKIKIEADKLQLKETNKARLRAAECIKKLYKMILQHQLVQKQCIIENSNRKIAEIEESFDRENDANKNLSNQLELRINEMEVKINSSKSTSLPNKRFIHLASSSSFAEAPKEKFSKSIDKQSIGFSASSTLPPLNPGAVRSSALSNKFKKKREMIQQTQKISMLNVKLNDVQKIFVNVKRKPVSSKVSAF